MQVYADHRLVTDGSSAIMRHPMYLSFLVTRLGCVLHYRTRTLVFLAANFLGLLVRSRCEELALADEFGLDWQAYCERVPFIVPFVSRRRLLRLWLQPHGNGNRHGQHLTGL